MSQKFVVDDDMRREVCVVVGTRPGIIMLAPVIHALKKANVEHFVLHTGQHYSPSMDSELFEDLRLDQPAYHIQGVAKKTSHAGQTAVMLEGCENAFFERRPKLVLVNGDANTNLAAALAARKLHLGVGHIEAGERSYDWSMPEEHNRRMLDHISDLLFASNEQSRKNLEAESILGKIHVTGNTIVDASLNHLELANERSGTLRRLNLSPESYILVTSHREENVDVESRLKAIIDGVTMTAEKLNKVALFVAHPRTVKRIKEFGLEDMVESNPHIKLLDSTRYLDFLYLLKNSALVLTDSGGVQQEAYIHQRPTVTMRDNTEWTDTLSNGCNRLSGASDAETILTSAIEAVEMKVTNWPAIFGDGKASERIAEISGEFIGS